MTDLVRTILIMSLTGSVLALLLLITKPLTRHRLPNLIQYYLWLVVIIAMLVPVSRMIVLPQGGNQAVPVPATPIITETITRFVITQAEETERLQNIAHLANTNPPIYLQERQAVQSPITLITTYFVLIYPFGVLVLLLYYAINYVIFIGLYRRRNRPAGPEAEAMLTGMCQGRPPKLYYNQLAETPMLFGIFRSAIILPYQEYTRDEMQAILSHELTHLRRRDVFVKWLTLIATALHWFNPLVWLASREIDRTCELSCDEAVISGLDTFGKRTYGNTLILVAAHPKTPRAVTSATMSEDKKNLKERLGAIMKSRKHTRFALAFSSLLIVAAVVIIVALGVGSEGRVADIAEDPPAIGVPLLADSINPDDIDSIHVVLSMGNPAYGAPSKRITVANEIYSFVNVFNNATLGDYADISELATGFSSMYRFYSGDMRVHEFWFNHNRNYLILMGSGWRHISFDGVMPFDLYQASSATQFTYFPVPVDWPTTEPPIDEPDPYAMTLNIAQVDNELFSTFDHVYAINYRNLHLTHWGNDLYWMEPVGIAIWSDVPLRDFEIIKVFLNHTENGTAHAFREYVYHTIELLDIPLLLEWFWTPGIFPTNGIAFTDPYGVRRQFAIRMVHNDDHTVTYRLVEFQDGEVILASRHYVRDDGAEFILTEEAPWTLPYFITIRGVPFATSLTELDLNRWALTNEELEPLRYMTNLTELSIANTIMWAYGTHLTDISPLAGLTNLRSLDLNGNRIECIAPLAGLTNLVNLSIGGNLFTDLAPLAGLTNLEHLSIGWSQVSDLTPLARLTNLWGLHVGGHGITSVAPLANLMNLTFLDVGSSQISDISPLAGLTRLEGLGIGFNLISDLSPVANMPHLDWLYAGNNNISDLSPLEGMSNITRLFLYTNQISDISPLASLTNLAVLNLNQNQISDISPLAGLDSFEDLWGGLWLDDNQITDWSPVAHLQWVGHDRP